MGLWIPRPLNARLDALVRRVNEAGENTNRKEVLAALLLAAPAGASDLREALQRYRTAEAHDAVVTGESEEPYLNERERRPGPRPRHRAD